MTSDQKKLIVFLGALVGISVVAVLAAVFGVFGETETIREFAKWGQAAVLGEIILLFVFAARTIFSKKELLYAFVVKIDPEHVSKDIDLSKVEEIIFTQTSWDKSECFLEVKGAMKQVSPTRSPGGYALEINVPGSVCSTLDESETLSLHLKDTDGELWEVSPFHLYKRVVHMKVPSKLLKSYEDECKKEELHERPDVQ